MTTHTHKPKLSLAQRAKRDPNLLRRALADPGLRSKLPSSMLTVAQRRARQANTTQNALGDVTTPLTGKTLVDVAKSLTSGQYKPQFDELDSQGRQAQAQATQSQDRTKAIYGDLAKYQTAALAAQQNGQASTAANISGITQAALGQLSAAQEQDRAQAAQDEAVRGSGLDGGAQQALAEQSHAAQQGVTDRGQIAGNSQQLNAQTANAVLGGIGASTQQRGAEHGTDIDTALHNALTGLADKRSTLTGEQASSLTDTLLKLRQSGSDQYLTGVGLGIKQQTADDSAKAKDAALKVNSKHWAETTNQYGVTRGAWADWGKTASGRAKRAAAIKDSKAKPKGSAKDTSATPAAQGTAHDNIASAASLVQQYKKAGVDRAQLRTQLLRGQAADKTAGKQAIKPVNAVWLDAALDLSYPPYKLSKATVAALHARHLKVNDLQLDQLLPRIPGLNIATPGLGG